MRPAILLLCCACAPADSEFLERLREDGYRELPRAPGWETPRSPAQGGPHGDFLDIYVDESVADAIAEGMPLAEWPEGALVVKDAWHDADGERLRFTAAMEKRDGRWFWAEWNADDEVIVEAFDTEKCTRCHDAGDDGVLAFDLP